MNRISLKKQGIICMVAVLFSSCSSLRHSGKSGSVMPGTWQATPIKIDGDCTDWPSPYPNYDAKAMIAYATSNDAENLYITMQTGDPLTQIKILKQGMTVSIDTGGRKEPQFHILFPLQTDDDLSDVLTQGDKQKGEGPMHLTRQFEQKLQKSADGNIQFSLEGFRGCNGAYIVSQTIPCGIQLKMKIDEYKQLVWEAIVPFSAIYGMQRIDAVHTGKAISVGFAVKGYKNPSSKNNVNNNTTPLSNGNMGGGMGAGGRANSMPMGAGSNASATENPLLRLYESTKTWKHFLLVSK